ncbi:15345_t:CDS:2, partial [Cetraspora pellucida]
TNYKVLVYELPLDLHETCISAIIKYINQSWSGIDDTDARTCADRSGKEPDASYCPMKPKVPTPTRSDEKRKLWPNIIVEVTYTKSIKHVFKKVKDYWLKDLSRAHDTIVVKIDPISEDETPSHMRFEFGTHDGAGNPLNILQGTCLIKINLDCLYHQAHPDVQIPRTILPDPIVLDFFFVRNEILRSYRD